MSHMLRACPVAAMAAAGDIVAGSQTVPATATVVPGATSAHWTMLATWRAGSQRLVEQTGGANKPLVHVRTNTQGEAM